MEHDSVVLFSSGLDSLACASWAKANFKNPMLLYIDIGVPYTNFELQAADVLQKRLGIPLNVEMFSMLGFMVDSLGHVRFRNLFFLEIAALFADNVVFGMLRGEYSEDKSPAFVRRMQSLFDSQTKRNLYNSGRRILIHTPFAKMTKTEVVTYLMGRGFNSLDLGTTIGCLNSRACGKCMSCLNRAIAFVNNGYFEIDRYEGEHPARWGLQMFRSNDPIVNKAKSEISLWKKRYWLWDAYKAYNIWKKRGIVEHTPLELMLS